ncbi:hypothetical protein PNV01_10580 [Turicibacter sanguinis]|nr:hypothetical protein [Turicibacter sanguinis]MDB8545255.1 hypothetical protein [Turicibacter sanguinis]
MERYECSETYLNGEKVESDLLFEQVVLDEIAELISQIIIKNQK